MRKAVLLITIILISLFASNRPVYASTSLNNEVYAQICEQLRSGNNAIVKYDPQNSISWSSFEEYAVTEGDDVDCLYDGAILFIRGSMLYSTDGQYMSVSINRGFNIEEAEKLTDLMVKEISEGLNENSSDRDKMQAICTYLGNIYKYDREAYAKIKEEGDSSLREDFVTAYYGDREIMCSEFATVTYIVANKMGLNCDVMYCVQHVFNIVKFEDNDHWVAYDLAGGGNYPQLDTKSFNNNLFYHVNEALKEEIHSPRRRWAIRALRLNRGRDYELAGIKEIIHFVKYTVFVLHDYRGLYKALYPILRILTYVLWLVAIIKWAPDIYYEVMCKIRRRRKKHAYNAG